MRHGLLRSSLAFAVLALAPPLDAQQTPTRAPTETGAGARAANLSAEASAKLAEIEAQLARARAQAEEWAAKAADYEQARAAAPERLRAIEEEIAALQSREPVELPKSATLDEIEAQLVGAQQDFDLARKEAAELEAESARRSERRKRIPELLAAAKERLRALEDVPAGAPDEAPQLIEARGQLADARRVALEQEIDAYEKELTSYEARGALLARRLDRATLRVARNEARTAALRDAVTIGQQVEAARDAERASELLEAATALPPTARGVVRQLAEQNAELARQRTGDEGLVGKIDDVSRKLARAEGAVAAVEAEFARLETKIEAAGLSDSVGLLLRRQRSEAPDVGKYRRFIRMRQEQIGAVQLQQIELRERRRELADIDRIVETTMARLDPDLGSADRARIESLLRDLLETKRRYTEALIQDYETYFERLIDFDAKQQELIDRTEQLLRYIDERILWIPSGEAVRPSMLADGRDALAWFMAPRFWGQLGRALARAVRDGPILFAAVVIALLASLPLARRVRPRIRALGERARETTCTRYAPTWQALGYTILLVPWLPGLLAVLGWQLGISPGATQFTRCVAHGMLMAAALWFTLEIPRQLLRDLGVAEAHLGWPRAAVEALRRDLLWLTASAVPAVFLIYVFELRDEEAWRESIGRALFVATMAAALVFTHRAMRERSGALREIARAAIGSRIPRWLWRLAYSLAVALPVFLAAAALSGYYWTALRLAAPYHLSLFFLVTLFVVLRLGGRWSLLARRRLVMEQARQRVEAERRAREAKGEAEPTPEISEPEVDVAAAGAQTGRLLTSTALFAVLMGLWLIWADVLPAVGILREVELWTTTETVTVETADAEGERLLTSEERVAPVTLADLLRALLIGVVALVLVRNLPGLLEMALLGRAGIGAGERYAYATILRYGITLAALVLAFNAVGVGWSSIQWLVAAVGLGLGFGLQEIFANFVSGLIILFERPIRVGDTVTVGDISGTVTRIRIRATWITGFDRKELVVPNKEFVTGRLVNWSLSDAILRVDVPVGIAYGSDTDKALEVLHRVAAENEHVLKDPEPQAWFLSFGDSSLEFQLRVFSPDVAHMFLIRHQIHMAIDRAFRDAGIEIAFPQRDLHVRSVPDAWKAVERPRASES
ncbi:MAG: mechanosensitive ion channel [Deltaproteobacteria bacterium]|nr:MAG: mechanosensitive ion channel [Deltaproteobacteria bacterium]